VTVVIELDATRNTDDVDLNTDSHSYLVFFFFFFFSSSFVQNDDEAVIKRLNSVLSCTKVIASSIFGADRQAVSLRSALCHELSVVRLPRMYCG